MFQAGTSSPLPSPPGSTSRPQTADAYQELVAHAKDGEAGDAADLRKKSVRKGETTGVGMIHPPFSASSDA